MEYVLYIYVPSIDHSKVIVFLSQFEKAGFTLTHLSKRDNPKRWAGDNISAAQMIMGGSDSTNWSFFRDRNHKIDGDIQIHNDPRWTEDTISLSSPDQDSLRSLAKSVAKVLQHYVIFDGTIGKGKNQTWHIISMSADCPSEIKEKIKIAEPGA